MILCGLFSLFTPVFVNAQGEIAFTNKVTYTKTGSIIGVRLVSLMPAPVTNEYQEMIQVRDSGRSDDYNAHCSVVDSSSYRGSPFKNFKAFSCHVLLMK